MNFVHMKKKKINLFNYILYLLILTLRGLSYIGLPVQQYLFLSSWYFLNLGEFDTRVPPYNFFPTDESVARFSLIYHYYHRKCSDGLHYLLPPILTFTAEIRHATNAWSNPTHSVRIPRVRMNIHWNIYSYW